MADLKLQCECGEVKGILEEVSHSSGNRLMCYCKDCQAFPIHLGKAEMTLDEAGGTEIYQIPPAKFKIQKGHEHLACLQLKENGLFRWYTSCCNTPIGNTVGASLPFVGVIHTFIQQGEDKDALIGPIEGNVNPGGATQEIPESTHKGRSGLSMTMQVIRRLLWWKLQGLGEPNPLHNKKGPVATPKVLN